MNEQNRIIREQKVENFSHKGLIVGEFQSPTSGQEKIYYRTLPSREESRVHLLFIHDIGTYHKRQFLFGEFLHDRATHVSSTWMDLPGHGFSTGTRAHISNFDDYCKDLAFLIAELQRRCPDEKIILLGTGVGALISLKTNQMFYSSFERAIDGLIILNPALKIRYQLPGWAQEIFLPREGFWSKMKLPLRVDGKDLTGDESLAEEYDSDPLNVHTITLGLYREVIQAAKMVRTSSYFIDIPTLILLSGMDGLYETNVSRLFAKGVARDLRHLIEYPDSYYDLFNDVHREKIFEDVYHWLEAF
jgi:alpha-beta hydrolase superfamily lysophospholipase